MDDKHFFDRFRVEQIAEMIEYFRKESESVSGEVIDAVKGNNFTEASMKAGALELCQLVMRRAERYLEKSSRKVEE